MLVSTIAPSLKSSHKGELRMKLTQEQAELFHDIHGRVQDDAKGITIAEYESAINAAFLMLEQAEAKIASLDKAVCEEIENRDHWEERASKLAYAVGEHFDVSVGEHSSANCPISNAHELLDPIPDSPMMQKLEEGL